MKRCEFDKPLPVDSSRANPVSYPDIRYLTLQYNINDILQGSIPYDLGNTYVVEQATKIDRAINVLCSFLGINNVLLNKSFLRFFKNVPTLQEKWLPIL